MTLVSCVNFSYTPDNILNRAGIVVYLYKIKMISMIEENIGTPNGIDRNDLEMSPEEANEKLQPGLVIEIQQPTKEWVDYEMKDLWTDRANLMVLYMNGRLRFKELNK